MSLRLSRVLVCVIAALAVIAASGAAQTAKKPAQAPAAKKAVRKSASKNKGARGKTSTVARTPRQLSPSTDRTREIQQALIDKGYLQGSATGVWNQDSTDAMKRFQEKENLSPTGKVSAKSLITLGLGPKDEPALVATPTASK